MMQGEDERIILSSCAVEHCLNPFKVESYEKQIFQPFLPLPGFSTLNAKAAFGATEHFRSTLVKCSIFQIPIKRISLQVPPKSDLSALNCQAW
jgi:hypothetical protein